MSGRHNTLNITSMQKAAQEATAMLRALANEDRLLLLCQISQREQSVSELEQILGIQQPTLSQQLGVLRAEGLVNTRRDGKRVFYSVTDPKAMAILHMLYNLYCPNESGD